MPLSVGKYFAIICKCGSLFNLNSLLLFISVNKCDSIWNVNNLLIYCHFQNSLVISGIKGREYKPQYNKTVLFFKNIDLCNFDQYGTCEIMELIVQLIRRSGFYTESLEWINVTDLIICCSMLNGQKHHFSARFSSIVQHFNAEWVVFQIHLNVCNFRYFRIFACRFPNDVELHLIMKNQFTPMSRRFKPVANSRRVDQIVECLIDVYNEVCHQTVGLFVRLHTLFSSKS